MGLTISLNKECPHCQHEEEIFDTNITHNLIPMAVEAHIYEVMWRPEENGIAKAYQMIEPLRNALELMATDPERFEKLTPSNKWGSRMGLMAAMQDLLNACVKHPDASVKADR